MPQSSWLWPIILSFSALGAGLVVFTDVPSPIRPLVAAWFLFVCPGMAFVRLLRLKEGFSEWILAIALSFTLDAIVAMTMLYARKWSPEWGLIILIGLSLGGAFIQIIKVYGRKLTLSERATISQHNSKREETVKTSPRQHRLTSLMTDGLAPLSQLFAWSIAVGGVLLLVLLFLFNVNTGSIFMFGLLFLWSFLIGGLALLALQFLV